MNFRSPWFSSSFAASSIARSLTSAHDFDLRLLQSCYKEYV
jgi:hypothetical protein